MFCNRSEVEKCEKHLTKVLKRHVNATKKAPSRKVNVNLVETCFLGHIYMFWECIAIFYRFLSLEDIGGCKDAGITSISLINWTSDNLFGNTPYSSESKKS